MTGNIQAENVPPRKSRWTSIYTPMELKDKIKYLSEKTGKTQWRVVLEALALYETQLRHPRAKEELPVVDKVIWYIQKLCMSVGALKENPSDANFQKTQRTVQQVKERLGVDTRIIERALSDFMSTIKSGGIDHSLVDEVRSELNMALKSVIIEIIYKYVLKEGEEKNKSEDNQTSTG